MTKKPTTTKKKSPTKQKIPIDWREVDKYLIGGALGTQVAAALGVCPDTLYDRCVEDHKILFSEYSAKKRQKGDMMLHAKQFQVAMNGNVSMLIWLGKQRLGQREPEIIQKDPENKCTFNDWKEEQKNGSNTDTENKPS